MKLNRLIVFLVIALLPASTALAAKSKFEGFKKCGGCHKSQKDSWLETAHAKAFESLKPNVKADAKKKAKLDPVKDYTGEKDCVGCHTTGFGENGGYKVGMSANQAKFLYGIGCEDCHGSGSLYRKEHSKAGDKYKKAQKSTERKVLVDAGENYDYEAACARCHLNYEGSPWAGAKVPFTPFTPKVDAKYKFDFEKGVRNNKAMHEHFKLKGVFDGEPVVKMRAEFQKTAKDPAEGEEEEE